MVQRPLEVMRREGDNNMSYETILYETKERIAYVTLNRPRVLNAYNDTMGDELLQAHRAFDQDDDLHVLIISGAGRAFCSGADVRQRQLRPVDELKRLGGPAGGIRPAGGLLGMGQTVNWKPVIAAVHGYVLGAGFGLAMATDVIVAAAGTKFQIREVQRGIAGAQHWATTWFWGGGRFATEIALTGRYFSAEEAYQFGIVNRVVPQDQVLAAAERLAQGILSNPPLSVRANVRVSRWFARRMEEEALYYQGGLKLHLTEDFRESAQAFIEKRPPEFKGR
jgi:enoyl-CoA hydratase/carnithine racemase